MKKILLLNFLSFITGISLAQSYIYPDSMRVMPAVPSCTDSVYLETWVTLAYQGTVEDTIVMISGQTITVEICYGIGLLPALDPKYVKAYLGNNFSGTYQVIFVPFIKDMSSGNSCIPHSTYGWGGDTTAFTACATGTGEVSAAPDLFIFPNPTQGQLQFETRDENTLMEIYDLSGMLVFSKHFFSAGRQELNLRKTNLHNGMYFLHLRGRNKNVAAKFMLQR